MSEATNVNRVLVLKSNDAKNKIQEINLEILL